MRAQNHKSIYRAYWKFSGFLAATVLVGVLTSSSTCVPPS